MKSILAGAGAFLVALVGSSLLGVWAIALFPRFARNVLHAMVDDTGGAYLFGGWVRVFPPGWLSVIIGMIGFALACYMVHVESRPAPPR